MSDESAEKSRSTRSPSKVAADPHERPRHKPSTDGTTTRARHRSQSGEGSTSGSKSSQSKGTASKGRTRQQKEKAADEPEAQEPQAEESEAEEPEAGNSEAEEPESQEPEANEDETEEADGGEADESDAEEPEAADADAGEPEADEEPAEDTVEDAAEDTADEPDQGDSEDHVTSESSGRKKSAGGSASGSKGLTAVTASRHAVEQFHGLTGRTPEAVVGVSKNDQGWSVRLEVVEARRIPDSSDLLAEYDIELDSDGDIVNYARGDRYVRGRPS